MSKLAGIRVIEIPKFRAVSSGLDTFDGIFAENGFEKWLLGEHKKIIKKTYEAPDFMWHEGDKNVWIWAVEDWVTEADTSPYELIEFEGGIYVSAVADEKDDVDCGEVYNNLLQWIKNNNVFESDDRPGHRIIFHRIGTGEIEKAIGIAQQEMFLPIKIKKQ